MEPTETKQYVVEKHKRFLSDSRIFETFFHDYSFPFIHYVTFMKEMILAEPNKLSTK